MTSAQIRAARGLLDWTVRDLAERARVDRNTVSNIETGAYAGAPETLEAIRRARRPDFATTRDRSPQKVRTDTTFAGNIGYVSIFDAVQVIENAKMIGLMVLKSDLHLATVSFNEGRIVDAECNGRNGTPAFRDIIEINSGTFEFSTAENEFAVIINVSSNTNFLLDVLTELDNERAEKQGLRSGS